MKELDILATINIFAYSQGFYGRLLQNLLIAKENQPEKYRAYMDYLESQNFKDALDLVLFLES